MKHTFELSGSRRATINIPAHTFPQQQQEKNTQGSCCDSKVVMMNCGCSTQKSSSLELRSAIAELQASYDNDVKGLEDRIAALEKERDCLKVQHDTDILKQKHDYAIQIQRLNSTIQLLRSECKRKDLDIASLINQKDIIMRNKINQFRQSQYVRIRELEETIRIREIDFRELEAKLELSHKERLRVEEKCMVDQNKWEIQTNSIKVQLRELQNRGRNQRVQYQFKLKSRQVEFQKLMAQLSNQSKDRKAQQSQLTNKFDVEVGVNKEMQTRLEQKDNQIQVISTKVQLLEKQIGNVLLQRSELSQNINQLRNQSMELMNKLQISEQAVLIMDNQKGDILMELSQRLTEIEALKKELASQEKVVEVRIQRVIDGKIEIDQLRSVISELQNQLKQFSGDRDISQQELRKSRNTVEQMRKMMMKLQAEIAQLKAYIQKREGTFKWAVQRQIERDMAVCESGNQIYKVSQVREFTRDAPAHNQNQNISEAISSGFHVINPHVMSNISSEIIFQGQNNQQ